ncbi:hypothetical protein BCBBV1cgp20 [Bacillus phage BCASJ1c]|uniref:20 n=1 Tax=Bacillus phage BCASJ1c TaxID=294382 RepID=Q5YA90_9CAUD|nr:hypothetical protein BCBBV1cgp20 [Bacillus phage BCASJ1c]AAU85067.1 20 [Bacillus phage BCASJ1c]
MNKCVECKSLLKSPRQVPLCDKCYQEMFVKKVKEEEVLKA